MSHPVLYPFPHEQAHPNLDTLGTFYSDATQDAVQLNVNLGGATGSWNNASAYYDIRLPRQLSDLSYWDLPCGLVTGDQLGPLYVDLWRQSTLVNANYIATDYSISYGPVTPGLRTYKGVSAFGSGYGYGGYIECVDVGQPILLEFWFSDNTTKTTPGTFHGYTFFGDMADAAFRVYSGSGYVRRYVFGILKLSADSTNPADSDFVCGGILDDYTYKLIVDGRVIMQRTAVSATEVSGFIETAFEDTLPEFGGFAQGFDSVEISVGDQYISYNRHSEVGKVSTENGWYDIADPPLFINTLDVKFVNYIDRVGGAGNSYYVNPPAMFTTPTWTSTSQPEYYSSWFWTQLVYSTETLPPQLEQP